MHNSILDFPYVFKIFNLKAQIPPIVPWHNLIFEGSIMIRKQHTFNYPFL